jgi:N-acetylmuramoyl-L-alanine amidase
MKPATGAAGLRRPSGMRLLSVLMLLASAAFAQDESPRINAVRFWSLGDVTRVAIETGGEARYQAERIDTPDRLVVDLIGVRRPAGTRGVQTIPVGDRLVKQLRIAVLQPGVTRVVIDLAAPLEYSISQLTNPDRLIVELRLAGPAPAPPVRSVTGSHSVDAEPASTAKPEPPAAAAAKLEPSASRKIEPAAQVPARFEPAAKKPESAPARTEIPAPVRLEPAAKKTPLTAAAAPPATPREEPPALPFVPPAADRTPNLLPEPPRIAPKKEKLDAAPPFERAQAAQRDSRGDRSLIRTLGLKLDRIVIDPGHGGHDTGTIGPAGMMEKNLVLDVARRLGALITARIGSEVIYTRSDDTFIPLEERTHIANEKKADLFLSIHANSSQSPRISGSETFYLNFTTSADALEVAGRENATSQTSIHDLQNLVQKIALNEKVQESREFASTIQKALYSGIPRNRTGANRGVKKAPFVVLIGAQMPSVLAEIAFLSNPRDESLLQRGDYRQKIAEALFKGLSQYASALSHFQVARQQPAGSQSR